MGLDSFIWHKVASPSWPLRFPFCASPTTIAICQVGHQMLLMDIEDNCFILCRKGLSVRCECAEKQTWAHLTISSIYSDSEFEKEDARFHRKRKLLVSAEGGSCWSQQKENVAILPFHLMIGKSDSSNIWCLCPETKFLFLSPPIAVTKRCH